MLRKDLRIEMRTGEIVTTSTVFSLLVVVTGSLAFHGAVATEGGIAAAVVWLAVVFSAVLAVGRTWQREREEGALDGLLAAPLSRSAIFAGKALGVLAFLWAILLVVLPVAAVLFSFDLVEAGTGLVLIGLAATPGIAASGTLFGSMTVRTRARELILAIVLLPLLSPTLLAAVVATRELLGGASVAELFDYFKLMVMFDICFVGGGLVLFEGLVEN